MGSVPEPPLLPPPELEPPPSMPALYSATAVATGFKVCTLRSLPSMVTSWVSTMLRNSSEQAFLKAGPQRLSSFHLAAGKAGDAGIA